MKKRILALTLALSLLLTSCGGGASAATMHLRKTEGTVGVSDGEGKDVEPREDLGLFSGYGVHTSSESYAWIDLDEVKLAKLDQDSEIAITKEDKKLEIEVKAGALFFNVTEPLADDETMNIRTSTMLVGIRGTCGWVVSSGDRGAQVFLLEGAAEAEAASTGETVRVTAGNMAEVTVNENGETEITVRPFVEEYIAPFVLTELENDEALCAAILEDSGLDVLNPPDPAERLRAEYLDIINSRTILDDYAANTYTANGLTYASEGLSYAAIIDFDGDGTDELILVTRQQMDDGFAPILKLEVYGQSQGHAAPYGEADFSKLEEEYGWGGIDFNPNNFYLTESNGQVYAVAYYGVQYVGDSFVYTIENNALTLAEHTESDGVSDQYWESDWELTEQQNICPPISEDAQMKNALLHCLDTHGAPMDYCFAKLAGTDLYVLDEIGTASFWKYSWNGTEIERTILEDNIVYAKLIDMDQDGEKELILIFENDYGEYDENVTVYSWDASGIRKKDLQVGWLGIMGGCSLLHDTLTGDIYIGSGHLTAYTFAGLTDTIGVYRGGLEYNEDEGTEYYTEFTIFENGELRESDQDEYGAYLRRFESVDDNIELSEDNYEAFSQLRYTVDEVWRQLTAR